MIWPNRAPDDPPALEVARLRFVKHRSEVIDPRQNVRRCEGVGPKSRPAIHVSLSEVRVLKEPPKPGILVVVELWPIPVARNPTLLPVHVAEREIPIPDRSHVDLPAPIFVVERAEAKAIDILGRFDQQW